MQKLGFVYIRSYQARKKILLLVQSGKTCMYYKQRLTGADGEHLIEEEHFFNSKEGEKKIKQLEAGQVIAL